MKRVIRVWRILAVALVCLAFLAAFYVTITGSPHHVFLKKIYSVLGILGSDPPPKYILFFALILFAEIPFMIRAGDSGNVFSPTAPQDSDEPVKEKRPQKQRKEKQPKPAMAARERKREREEEILTGELKDASELEEQKARERAEKKACERAVKPASRKEYQKPDALSDVQGAAEEKPSPDASAETAEFDRFLSELKAELFEE